MKINKIAAQLYTVREFCKTPEDLHKTVEKIKEIGFDAVQVSGIAPIDVCELKKILDGEGLKCCATHEPGKAILEETERIIERLKILGCKYAAYPNPHVPLKSATDYSKLAKDLSNAGARMAESGLVLCYHNHAREFELFDGRLGLDIIYDESDSKFLQGEIDTYWVQAGGQNPAKWCKKLKGRLPLIHLKDYGIIENVPTMFEIGRGNLDWEKILKSAKKAGVEWFIIEQDSCRRDPFESLKISLEYLKEEF
ncbi:MAG TPA: sugar phosphate isomerase/epimerase [Victivallales bacterium]|nr:sugar phosphate isomerase/epimerase [Victivallales bacterium]